MKDLSFKVMRLLADGDFHSGEAIARALGMSRASVWNAVRELDSAGLDVYKVRGRGYRFAQPLSLLEAGTAVRELGRDASRF